MAVRITVVGSLNMDMVVRVPRLPRPGETVIGSDFRTIPGGKGANQAVAAARLGAQTSMVGRVGRDDFGRLLLDNLAAAQVDHRFVRQDPGAPTGVAFIEVDDAGKNSIVVASGANARLTPADVDIAAATITAASALLLQLEIPLETVARAAAVAHAAGVKVILNPAPARPLPAELLALVDVLVPNESETEILTGLPVGSQAEAERAALTLLEAGVGAVVLTLGERGALLAQDGRTQTFPAFEVKPADVTAAGDAFLAGFAVALAEGKPLAEAVRWGNAAGALATTKLGAQPSLPTRQEVERLLAEGVTRPVPTGKG
ncbi:MAG: ribokinase [Anaerolineae bacterium]|nr:ribokinase [Anaerolineae bacterium]